MSKSVSPNVPRPVSVKARKGVPLAVAGEMVEAVRDSWLIEDQWWTERPIRRHYHELVGVRGRNLVVFCDLRTGGWFRQTA
jgi:hypothetical protein